MFTVREAVSGAVLAVLLVTEDAWLRLLLLGPEEVEEVEEQEEDDLGIAVMMPVVLQVTLGRGLLQHTHTVRCRGADTGGAF